MKNVVVSSQCRNCNKRIGLFILAWVLYVCIFIPTLVWSTQLLSQNTPYGKQVNVQQKYGDISMLTHYETFVTSGNDCCTQMFDVILYSTVCPLGKFAFYILTFLMLFYLMTISIITSLSIRKCVTYGFAGVFTLIFLLFLVNCPLFVRSIPAMIATGGIIAIVLSMN